jgi:hypothetical protein
MSEPQDTPMPGSLTHEERKRVVANCLQTISDCFDSPVFATLLVRQRLSREEFNQDRRIFVLTNDPDRELVASLILGLEDKDKSTVTASNDG